MIDGDIGRMVAHTEGDGGSERRFRQVVNGSRDAFIEFDADLCITEWSARAEEVYGWTRAEMAERTVLDIVSDRFADVVEQGVAVLRSMEAAGELQLTANTRPLTVEVELVRKAGTALKASASIFTTGSGDAFRIGVFIHEGPPEGAPRDGGIASDRLHDELTGLPNRVLFSQRLSAAIAELRHRSGSVAVAVLGLDRFKAINDAMGHDAGDEVLVAVASRLRSAGGGVRPLVSRLGGDVFLAFFEHPAGAAGRQAEAFTERALTALEAPFAIADTEVFVTASAGVAASEDEDAQASTLLSDAEAAMHECKAGGGGGSRVFGQDMRRQVVERLNTERSLHRALARRELTLFYQPVVDISGSNPVGVEALIRWQHPDQGLMAPDRFIPVAEESGLIIPIGAWVLEEACRQLHHLRQSGDGERWGTVEVNLSARQIDHPEIVATVEKILETTELAPENLTLEITESALMRDAVSALAVLKALKHIGVALAIDDFGTGYSSLSYLQRFPLDILKIDKSFIDGLAEDQGVEIVAAVVNLAHALGLDVVAEGVETGHQLGVLRQLGCDFAQGYLFSRPVPARDLSRVYAMGA